MAVNEETLRQPAVSTKNWTPTAKVSVGILAASLTTVLMPFFTKAIGSTPDPSQAAAITTLITFGIQYMVPER